MNVKYDTFVKSIQKRNGAMRLSQCQAAVLLLPPHPFALAHNKLLEHSSTIVLGAMAEIIDMTSTTPPVSQEKDNTKLTAARAPKAGRKPKFTAQEDLIITQGAAAAEAHLTADGETHARFQKAAEQTKANPNFNAQVTSKSVQDRFKKLLEDFASKDAKDRNLSGVGAEKGELEDLFSDMLEAQRDRDAKKDVDAKERAKQEQKRLAAGNAMVLTALLGKKSKKNSSSEEESPAKKRRVDVGDGMTQIGLTFRESEATRVELERERLQFDLERLEKENAERVAERAERAKEREQRALEVSSYRSGMGRIMEENAKQAQAMMGMIAALVNREVSKK